MGLVSRMKFKMDIPLCVLNMPEGMEALLGDMTCKTTAGQDEAQVLLFAKNKKTLDAFFKKLCKKLAGDALLWIAYPKKNGSIASDITRDNGWEVVTAAGYDGVAQVAIDENWSALRFRKSEAIGAKLRDIPMEERSIDGVDFINRTATLPVDAQAELKNHRGLQAFFDGMSFSHKKEYVQAIAEAKKPETRQRRIAKMVEMLQELKDEKEKKTK